MAVELRPRTAIVLLVVVLAAGALGSVVLTEAIGEEYDPTTETITLEGDDRALWLYTSRAPSFDQWTLALNVVVYGDTDDVERYFRERGRGDWEETETHERDVLPNWSVEAGDTEPVRWELAGGAPRYVYVVGPDQWVAESYQLHDGDYLGSRHHLRAYTAPDGEGSWTAIQAHHEHWDWFNLQHVVTSVMDSQAHVEAEFVERQESFAVLKRYVGGEDLSDFNGWVTVVNPDDRSRPALLAAAVGLVAAVLPRRNSLATRLRAAYPSQEGRALVLAASLVAFVLSVRLAGVGLERAAVPLEAITVLLYPVLLGGLPAVAYLLARPVESSWAFGGATLGFLTAVLVDYTYLGVTTLPMDTLIHRAAMAAALGLVAAGGSRTERRDSGGVNHLQVGVLLWVSAVLLPMLRFTPVPV